MEVGCGLLDPASPEWKAGQFHLVQIRIFRITVPPTSAVPNAERLEDEAGNFGVQVRVIREAVLREFSVVTAAAYQDATVDLRADALALAVQRRRRLWL